MTDYAKDKPKDIEIYKVDVDVEEKLAQKYDAFPFPVIVYMKDGKSLLVQRGKNSVENIKKTALKVFK